VAAAPVASAPAPAPVPAAVHDKVQDGAALVKQHSKEIVEAAQKRDGVNHLWRLRADGKAPSRVVTLSVIATAIPTLISSNLHLVAPFARAVSVLGEALTLRQMGIAPNKDALKKTKDELEKLESLDGRVGVEVCLAGMLVTDLMLG
jgi:hypothetical protein